MDRRNSLYLTPKQSYGTDDREESQFSNNINQRPLEMKFNNNSHNSPRLDWNKFSNNAHPTLLALKNAFKEDHTSLDSMTQNHLPSENLPNNAFEHRNTNETQGLYNNLTFQDLKIKKLDQRRTLIPRPNTPPVNAAQNRTFNNEFPTTKTSFIPALDESFLNGTNNVHNSTNISTILADEAAPVRAIDDDHIGMPYHSQGNIFQASSGSGGNNWNRMNVLMLLGLLTAVIISKALRYLQLFLNLLLNQFIQLRSALVGTTSIWNLLYGDANSPLTFIAKWLMVPFVVFLNLLYYSMTILHLTNSFLLSAVPTGLVDFVYKLYQ
ncbi:uncharacterized protein [Musca autumnalis]|uniref:uncharacterized protein n=1 Tax=Musca autumnalis TaxID=221902 RepID=UPI003CF368A6